MMTVRALRDDERIRAAAIVTADYPTGTNWVPVAIDTEARRLGVLVQAPGAISGSLEEILMLAVA